MKRKGYFVVKIFTLLSLLLSNSGQIGWVFWDIFVFRFTFVSIKIKFSCLVSDEMMVLRQSHLIEIHQVLGRIGELPVILGSVLVVVVVYHRMLIAPLFFQRLDK